MNSKEALIKYRMEQAKESIDDARFLLDNNRSIRLIANRAYYAMFYAILALLQSKGLGSSKHSGAIALFNKEFINDNLSFLKDNDWLDFDLLKLLTKRHHEYKKVWDDMKKVRDFLSELSGKDSKFKYRELKKPNKEYI